jgi:Fe-S-cluster containining protein
MKRLGTSSAEFLSNHTISPFDKNLKFPVVLLKMNEDDKKSCPFVSEKGCGVYEDRPWACRMYPVGLASPPADGNEVADEEFYFLLKEDICKGHCEENTQTIREWLEGQGVTEYDEMGKDFKELTLHKALQEGPDLTPQKVEMFFLACYHLDGFRDFVFGSSFLDKFEVAEERRQKMKEDDVELLKFSHEWLRFALLGEGTMKVKGDVLEAKKKELEKRPKGTGPARPPQRP